MYIVTVWSEDLCAAGAQQFAVEQIKEKTTVIPAN